MLDRFGGGGERRRLGNRLDRRQKRRYWHGAATEFEGDDAALVTALVSGALGMREIPAAASPSSHHRDILDTIDSVRHRRRNHSSSNFNALQLLPSVRVVSTKLTTTGALEYKAAC